jgi:hypothetical protein
MGQTTSRNTNPVNYDCPVCMASNKLPNAGGRFFLINETQCQCNGCNTIFDKTQFYKGYTSNTQEI